MNFRIDEKGSSKIAILEDYSIKSTQDAVDLIAELQYNLHCDKLIIPKELLPEDFFILSTGIAGDILQKYTTYQLAVAIVGDFSKYQSKSLQDFIRESNEGKQTFFLADIVTALDKLHQI